jgi:hypothetical protein
MIDRIRISATAAGAPAGSASGEAYSPDVRGEVLKVHVAYTGDTDTMDVTLEDENDPASETIVNLVDQDTDVALYPRRVVEANDGTDLTYDGTRKVCRPYVVHGRLKLTIAQADEGDQVTAIVWVRR